MNKTKGFSALLSTGVLFGVFGIFIRYLNTELLPYQQIIFRSGVALFLALLLALVLRRKWSLNNVDKKYILFYAFAFPLANVFFTQSVLVTKISTTIFSLYIGSLVSSMVIGHFFFNEKMTSKKIMSLLFVFIGLLFFAFPFSTFSFSSGLLLGILAGISEGIANGFRKFLGNKIDRLLLTAIQSLGGVILCGGLLIASNQPILTSVSSNILIVGIIYGFLHLSISYLTLIGFSNFDLNLGTVILSSELIFGPLFAMIIFREFPTGYELVGGIFIILAIVIPNISLKKQH